MPRVPIPDETDDSDLTASDEEYKELLRKRVEDYERRRHREQRIRKIVEKADEKAGR